MIKAHWTALCALLALSCSPLVQAVEHAGMVKVATGQVTIERQGTKLQATVGRPIKAADRVRTGPDGSVGVTLRDNTLLSAGPNSLIVIENFAFDNATQDGSMSIHIRKGTLSVASGKIAKRTPESVDFHTPTSVLGVRGTEFAIEVEGGRDD